MLAAWWLALAGLPVFQQPLPESPGEPAALAVMGEHVSLRAPCYRLVCPDAEGGAIDASVTAGADGGRYLVWKNDGNCCGLDTWIQAQPLSADGASLTGEPTRLIKQTESWEGKLVEAPVIVRHDDEYVLLYSANDYGNSSYVTGAATAKSLLGPYTKSKQPLLSTSGSKGAYLGPGGEDLITFQGKDWMLFHSWDEAFAYRGMHAVPVAWHDGLPELAK